MGWNSGESSNDLQAGAAAVAAFLAFALEVFFFFEGAFALEAAMGADFFSVDFLVERLAAALLACLVFVRFAFLSTAIFGVLGKVQVGLHTWVLWSR